MSADDDDLGGLTGLSGLLDELDDVAPKVAAKRAPKKAAKSEVPVEESQPETPETSQTSPLTPEALASIREELKEEVLREFRAERAKAELERESALTASISSKHSGTEKTRSQDNPFALPTVENIDDLPKLVHFVADGFTINDRVAFRGQEYHPKNTDIWALLSTRDQISRYGEVKFRVGPWDGAPFDLDDPNLTAQDKKRLQAVMADRLANELKVNRPPESLSAEDI